MLALLSYLSPWQFKMALLSEEWLPRAVAMVQALAAKQAELTPAGR